MCLYLTKVCKISCEIRGPTMIKSFMIKFNFLMIPNIDIDTRMMFNQFTKTENLMNFLFWGYSFGINRSTFLITTVRKKKTYDYIIILWNVLYEKLNIAHLCIFLRYSLMENIMNMLLFTL